METAASSLDALIRYLPLAAAAPAVKLIVQDCRYGKISAGPLVLLGGIDMVAAGSACGPETLLRRLIWNFLLLAYMAGGIGLWLLLKKRTLSNLFKGYIGSGDLLFATAVSPLFGFREFLYFLLISCILALALRYPVLYFKRTENASGSINAGKIRNSPGKAGKMKGGLPHGAPDSGTSNSCTSNCGTSNCGTSHCGKPGVPSVPLVAYAGTTFIFFLFYKYFFF